MEQLLLPYRQTPPISEETIKSLLSRKYGIESVGRITPLNSYDDKNYAITHKSHASEASFVLKITNTDDSSKPDMLDGQNCVMQQLRTKNYPCPLPIANRDGQTWSVEEIVYDESATTGRHVVRLLSYLPGGLLTNVPRYTPNLLRDVGRHLGLLHAHMADYEHPSLQREQAPLWGLDSVPTLLDLVSVFDENAKQQLITDVVEAFKARVLPARDAFSKGIIHGDFNEQNILVEHDEAVDDHVFCGILDFGDMHRSCLVYDVGCAIMYAMLDAKKNAETATDRFLLEIGGHLLAGYLRAEGRSLNDAEFASLKHCVCARLAQSLTLGYYTYKRNPVETNTYVLITQARGWDLLSWFWSVDEGEVFASWRRVLKY